MKQHSRPVKALFSISLAAFRLGRLFSAASMWTGSLALHVHRPNVYRRDTWQEAWERALH